MFGKDPRKYSVMTKEFLSDDDGNVRGLITVDVEVTMDGIKVSQGGRVPENCVCPYLINERTRSHPRRAWVSYSL